LLLWARAIKSNDFGAIMAEGSTTIRPSTQCSLPAVQHMNRARLTLTTRMESLRE
jgi:hypothetical protein